MRFWGILKLAIANLGRVKVKTVLASIGVAIGCGAVVLLTSLGIGAKDAILNDVVTHLGDLEVITVMPYEVNVGVNMEIPEDADKKFTDEDVKKISEVEGVKSIYPQISISASKEDDNLNQIYFTAVTKDQIDFLLNRDGVKLDGRGELAEDSILIDKSTAENLGLKVGDNLDLNFFWLEQVFNENSNSQGYQKEVEVLGVYDSEDISLTGQSYISMDLARKILEDVYSDPEEKYSQLTLRSDSVEVTDEVSQRIKDLGYSTFTASDIIDGINQAFKIVLYVLGSVGGISLLVAMFGIANTMVMTVMERTREIGVLKSLGMGKWSIRLIFLCEAGFIGLIGGILGLFGGWLIGFVANTAIVNFGVEDIPENLFEVTWWLSCGIIVFAVIVSMLAGLAPASKAAKVDPVKALRSY